MFKVSLSLRLKICATVIFAALAVFGLVYPKIEGSSTASASASGPSPSHTGGPGEANCTACHTTFPVNSAPGGVQITGLPRNYLPGQLIPLTVTISQPDGVIYGFQSTGIDARGSKAGAFSFTSTVPPVMKTVSGIVDGRERQYIEHTISGVVPSQLGTKSWQFDWTAPERRVGKVSFYTAGNAADSDGSPNGDRIFTTSASTLSGTAVSNFDGDGRSEIAVFRPEGGLWFSTNSTDNNVQTIQWGALGDIATPGDFDGDGVTDRAVFRPNTGTWYIAQSTAGIAIFQFGAQGDVPVAGDYDGDLKTDAAVFRPADGNWWVLKSTGGFALQNWGLPTDIPVQGDYDGDAKTDIAVFRPDSGVWYILQSSDGFRAAQFGLNGDKPIQADYDGDGRHDVAVYRPSAGQFWINGSTVGVSSTLFGISEDKPVPADYDGDGRADIAVYRPSNGTWWAVRSSDSSLLITQFGLSGDVPVPSGYIAQ